MTGLSGVIPILSMPFDSQENIDFDGLLAQVDFLRESSVRAIGFGYGSEIHRLTEEEIWESLRRVANHVDGHLEIMASVGGGSIKATLSQAARARDAGADLLMLRPPPGDLDDIKACCEEVGTAIELPIVFQDNPEMTTVDFEAQDLVSLIKHVPNIAALKIESPDRVEKIGKVAPLIDPSVSVLGGAAGYNLLEELEAGAVGTVPFVAFAHDFDHVIRQFRSGDKEGAAGTFERLRPILELALQSADTAIYTFKELLRLEGVINDSRLRRPFEALPQDLNDRLLQLVR